ncbi:MAG: dihydropteroate synthase [Candidatus Omnitrophica bacterium]|nr:dihydropteroate synthase [Candidatus Omnitrophota bacterium]MCM8770640.1 dihydropteroate synthase [Candidatus Omnitrophota bacterium]
MFIIGELINGMYKEAGRAIREKDKSVIQRLAKRQKEAGADALDLNCGPVSKDPVLDMRWLIETVQEVVDMPLSLDSTKANVIEEGLKLVKNKAIINSTSADSEKLEILVPLAIKYNASLIGLTLDKNGVPQDKDRRLELAARIVADCQEKGFPVENLYIDPVVLPVNVAQNQAGLVLEVLKEFKIISTPAPKTIVGLSNISQGTTKRRLINRTFLSMAIAADLDAAILDPLDEELMNTLITSELILNKQIYCDSYLDAYRKR